MPQSGGTFTTVIAPLAAVTCAFTHLHSFVSKAPATGVRPRSPQPFHERGVRSSRAISLRQAVPWPTANREAMDVTNTHRWSGREEVGYAASPARPSPEKLSCLRDGLRRAGACEAWAILWVKSKRDRRRRAKRATGTVLATPRLPANRGVSIERLTLSRIYKRSDPGVYRDLAQEGVMLPHDALFRPRYLPGQKVRPPLE